LSGFKGLGEKLSRYHLLHPEYILSRIKELLRSYRQTILIVFVDTEDAAKPLGDVTRVAVLQEITLVCGWSVEVSVVN
jgi:DNA excision repair protein ERCC-1